mmetsp:Transcript_15817/g.23283  ORF Transcript_15817/g.23283 Transcript_15817/m.23283 type:complete len:83 (+) Transcript_15817:80-328(+)
MNNLALTNSTGARLNLQRHLTFCESEVRPLSLEAARQRLTENSQPRRKLSSGSLNDYDDNMEEKIIALDYKLKFDTCMSKSI